MLAFEHNTDYTARALFWVRLNKEVGHVQAFAELGLRLNASSSITMDWIGFGYAAAILLGGYMGYKRKGSVMSLMAGLVFGGLSAYGAYNISNKPTDIKVLLLTSGLLSLVMGTRYKKSGKLVPAGIMTILRSEFNSDVIHKIHFC
ncbi:transmembrane protein 14A isoform X2 [Phyllopteryx taeniolatus]|uniref:transmembrane protein 14A isoform X2 n=1 Tax=Phyllopteryx taeniolatus TaxID=161469 RepID=UPI002AD52CC5|nr:transmembrane protein 14A isoform X2 [Phyllopteryx taeniolatus]